MKSLLLYSHTSEPITQVLLSSGLDNRLSMIKLSVEDLIKEVTIIDEFDGNKTTIEWNLSSGEKVTNSLDLYLINRVLSIPDNVVSDFSEEDQVYSLSEIRAYLTFAIEAFPLCFSKPGAFGLSGNRFTLPRQWEMIKNARLPFGTPNYYLGNTFFCPLEGEIIYSKPSNFYFWKPNQNCRDEEAFAFVRPKGIPIVVCIVGNQIEIFSYFPDKQISQKSYSFLKEQALNLSLLFNYQIAECLFFLNLGDITFGMISNIPYASRNKSWFSKLICSFFMDTILRINGKN